MATPPPDDLGKPSHQEHLYRLSRFLAKATAGALAPVGLNGLVNELFDLLVSDPAAKRRDRFMESLARRLDSLEAEGRIRLEALRDNEDVAALLLRATQAAMRSSGEKKLQALCDTATRGLIGADRAKASAAQLVVGLLDRMTEFHVIILLWEGRPRPSYTLGQMKDSDDARRSLFYGEPVYTEPSLLDEPVALRRELDLGIYVEKSVKTAFGLARADLAATGLLQPVLKVEQVVERRTIKRRTTPDIVGYELSELGKFACEFIAEFK